MSTNSTDFLCLQIDIEGDERAVMKSWLGLSEEGGKKKKPSRSSPLDKVTQLAVEFHSVAHSTSPFIKEYAEIVAALTER